MFIKQVFTIKIKAQFLEFLILVEFDFLKKGMVSIYSSYVWRNKPIVKGSLKDLEIINTLMMSWIF